MGSPSNHLDHDHRVSISSGGSSTLVSMDAQAPKADGLGDPSIAFYER